MYSYSETAVRQWRFRFARDILPLVSKAFCSVHPIRYKDILELDRKIRDFDDYPDTYYQAECKIECSELYATFRILYPYITVLEKEESKPHLTIVTRFSDTFFTNCYTSIGASQSKLLRSCDLELPRRSHEKSLCSFFPRNIP